MADDIELLQRWRGGDTTAGNELVRRHFVSQWGEIQEDIEKEIKRRESL